jgi:hypothetical protein
MKVSRLHRWGKNTSTVVTFIHSSEAKDPLRPTSTGSSATEFERRVRQAKKRFGSFAGPIPMIDTGTTLKDLNDKYRDDILRGKELQKRMFGGSK